MHLSDCQQWPVRSQDVTTEAMPQIDLFLSGWVYEGVHVTLKWRVWHALDVWQDLI